MKDGTRYLLPRTATPGTFTVQLQSKPLGTSELYAAIKDGSWDPSSEKKCGSNQRRPEKRHDGISKIIRR